MTSHSQDSTAASDSEDATPISDPEYSPLTGPATSPASISYSIAASNGSTEFIDERDIITGPLAPPPYNTPYTSPPPAYGDVENTTLLATGEPVGDDGPGDDDGVQYDPYIWTDEDLAALEDYFGLNRYDIFNYRMVIMSLGGYITYLAIIATVVG